jgi:sterol desaturase/sphingolipid hydroxylase (fatty acid hydroxylase superfamily)
MPLLVTVVAAILLAAVERLPGARLRALPVLRAWAGSDFAYFVLGVVFASLTGGLVFRLSSALGALGMPRLAEDVLPFPVALVLCLVVLDLGQYVSHRLLHAVGALWAVHKVHHSARTLDWLANARSHILETTIRRVVAPLGLVLLGAPRLPTVLAGTMLSVWALFIHSNVRVDLRVLEGLVITPRLHRIHHMPDTTQKNFGSFFSIWDRLVGSLVVFDPPADATLGVPGEVESYPQSFLPQLVEPFRRR